MTCSTTFSGSWGNCNNGQGQPGTRTYTLTGKYTPSSFSQCGYTWTVFTLEGATSHYPVSFFSPSVQYSYSGCSEGSVNASQPYDCINGGCLPKTTYNTPGAFASLAACQSGCAKNSNCSGECISKEDLAALQQAANNLRNRYCK
jgi:hypothetical protein